MFGRLLIANRGSIGCRIIDPCGRLGVKNVIVYSDADASARHVRRADHAIHIGPAEADQSYLNIDRIVRAAVDSGAEAVHPGYGFLAENADFARAVDKRSEEHTSELQSRGHLVCRLLLEKKKPNARARRTT